MIDVIIIGAGIAGIATALRLRKQGKKVLVLEKNAYVGGKMNAYESMGYRWDTGPSLFTLPELVDELYLLYNKNPRDYYQYQQEPESCRYFFCDETQFTFYNNPQKLEEELSQKLSVNGAVVNNYLKKSAQKYDSIGAVFLETPIHKPSYLPWKTLIKKTPQLLQTDLFSNLHYYNKKTLKHPKLVQVFNRYATYNGSSPYKASGILSMIPHLEQNLGTYFPKEGMRSIVEGLYRLALEEGVVFGLEECVKSCQHKGSYYELETTQKYQTRHLVCAVDCVSFYKNILNDKPLVAKYQQQERSSSAVIFYWGINKVFPELGLHNIFFSEDYQQEFELIFDKKEIPFEGTIYVHISSKSNPNDAPNASENWFVMLNVPAGAKLEEKVITSLKETIINRLERLLDESIEPYIQTEKVWTPQGIELDTGAFEGALYGASSNSKLAALTRHPNFSKKYPNLYFCGGTVHPGGGIPLSIQSAKIVANLISNGD